MNIVHRLKYGVLLAPGLLVAGYVMAQQQVIQPGHWQEGMAVGVTEFSGTLYIRDVSWVWESRSVQMSAPDAVQAGLIKGQGGMVSKSRAGEEFYILGGRTSSLTTARPGLQPSVTLLQVTPSSPRIAARGQLSRGQVRYGEITFMIHHLLVWQDSKTADKGWSVISGEVTPYAEQQVKRQLWQISDYEWTLEFSGLTVRPDAFISREELQQSVGEKQPSVAGSWVTSLSNVQVNFPGAEEPVKRWHGSLTPVVVYF